MRNADELRSDFTWWTLRWLLLPGAILLLFFILTTTRIETRNCMNHCSASGYRSYIYAVHRWRPATCECVNSVP